MDQGRRNAPLLTVDYWQLTAGREEGVIPTRFQWIISVTQRICVKLSRAHTHTQNHEYRKEKKRRKWQE